MPTTEAKSADHAVVQAWVTHDVAQELRERAAAAERTVSSEIRLALRKHLKNDDDPASDGAGVMIGEGTTDARPE